MSELVCKFCGTELVRTGAQTIPDFAVFVPVHGARKPHYKACRNRAGDTTFHHPDSPEYNGGIDYSDGRSRS